jgi:hypothetical protein
MFQKLRSKQLLALLVPVLMIMVLIDPLGMLTGSKNNTQYSQIYVQLDATSDSKVLMIASWDDYYEIPLNHYFRNILNDRFPLRRIDTAERGYDEVLSYASLGELEFGKYLNSHGYTHILVPGKTADSGQIFHRWGQHGTIRLPLASGMFVEEARSGGDYPLALYRIKLSTEQSMPPTQETYTLNWANVREGLFSLITAYSDDYKPSFYKHYEDINVGWVLGGEQLDLRLITTRKSSQKYEIEFTLSTPYGPNAPPTILQFATSTTRETVLVSAEGAEVLTIVVSSNELIHVRNILGCRYASTFEQNATDGRLFCYGITNVNVRPMNDQ